MTRRCVPVRLADGTVARVQTAGQLNPADVAVIEQFAQTLHELHIQEDPTMTQSDEISTLAEPVPVDLVAADVDGWYQILRKIRDERERLDLVEEQARAAIERALGDNVEGVIDGRPVVRYSHTAAPRRFNRKQFAKDHPNLLAEYTTYGQPGRRFELLDPAGGDQ